MRQFKNVKNLNSSHAPSRTQQNKQDSDTSEKQSKNWKNRTNKVNRTQTSNTNLGASAQFNQTDCLNFNGPPSHRKYTHQYTETAVRARDGLALTMNSGNIHFNDTKDRNGTDFSAKDSKAHNRKKN